MVEINKMPTEQTNIQPKKNNPTKKAFADHPVVLGYNRPTQLISDIFVMHENHTIFKPRKLVLVL